MWSDAAINLSRLKESHNRKHTPNRETHTNRTFTSKCVAASPINQRCPADVVDVSTWASCWRIRHTSADIYHRSPPPRPPLESTNVWNAAPRAWKLHFESDCDPLFHCEIHSRSHSPSPLPLNQHTLFNICFAPPHPCISLLILFFYKRLQPRPHRSAIFCCQLWLLVFIVGLGLVVLRLAHLSRLSLADYFCFYTCVCVCVWVGIWAILCLSCQCFGSKQPSFLPFWRN